MSEKAPSLPRAFTAPGTRPLHLVDHAPPIQVTRLRREFTAVLRHDDIPHSVAEDAVSVFTELFTNCFRHCPSSRVHAGAALDPARNSLIGFVSDHNPRMIALPDPASLPRPREHGYGLHLVTHLTTTSRVLPLPPGKCVLFTLTLDNAPTPPPLGTPHAVLALTRSTQ